MTDNNQISTVPADVVLRRARIAGRSDLCDIGILDGNITFIRTASTGSVDQAREIDLACRIVTPSFTEPHLHLDKAFLGSPPGGATLAEAIGHTAVLKSQFTAEDVAMRARRVLAAALSKGTTAIRAQTEVDPAVGLLSVEVIRELAAEFADVMRIQIAVFPQEGITARPGTLSLMREALRIEGSVVGGCPYSERTADDARSHVDSVLDLAVEFDTLADLHLDLADTADDERFALAAYVARGVADRGLQGRVAIGHATSIASLLPLERRRILDALAEAEVTMVVLPATDLYLMGRNDDSNIRRGVAPLIELWEAGVPIALSSNNVQNAFTPTGTADPLDIALLAARVSHLSSSSHFASLFDSVSLGGARTLNPTGVHGLQVGAAADLVVFDSVATSAESVILENPDRHLVLSRGQLVFSEHRNRTFHGAARSLGSLAQAFVR